MPVWQGEVQQLPSARRALEGGVVLIGAEPQPPYERPPLSKEYLRSESSFEDALVQASDFYEENGIETRFGVRATRVDSADKAVELDGGERLVYDKLLVTTGGSNRRVPIPGIGLDGIYGLRTVADSDRIRAEISPRRRAVVVGMGFIGSEVAACSGNRVWKSRSWIGTRCRCAGFSVRRLAGSRRYPPRRRNVPDL